MPRERERNEAVYRQLGRRIRGCRKKLAMTQSDLAKQIVPLGIGTVFPNLSFIDSVRFTMVAQFHPYGIDKTLINMSLLLAESQARATGKAPMWRRCTTDLPAGLAVTA